eukprot:5064966-Amphidinium_carterae.1
MAYRERQKLSEGSEAAGAAQATEPAEQAAAVAQTAETEIGTSEAAGAEQTSTTKNPAGVSTREAAGAAQLTRLPWSQQSALGTSQE